MMEMGREVRSFSPDRREVLTSFKDMAISMFIEAEKIKPGKQTDVS